MRNLKLKVALILLLGVNVLNASAGIKPSITSFEEGESFDVLLSKFNFNRVFVAGESIVRVRIPEGTFIIDKSEPSESSRSSGSVYIKPLFDTEVTAYFTTNRNHHFSLRVTPDQSAGKTLKMVSMKPHTRRKPTSSKPSLRHDKRLTSLMSAMMRQGEIAGFVRTPSVHEHPFIYKKGMSLKLRERYQGRDFTGFVYRIQNTTSHPMLLSNALFRKPAALLVALETRVIKPGSHSYLYSIGRSENVG